MQRYKTLLMDADETLLDFKRSEAFALETTLRHIGVTMTEEMRRAYHEINRRLWQRLECLEITRDRLKVQRFEELFVAFDIHGIDAAAFNEAYMQTLGSKGFVLDGADELLKTLSKTYRIYVITNGTACVQHTRFADSGLLPYIQALFISQEIGADKPSSLFFDHVLSEIGCTDKRELLIVGDSLTSDIRGGLLCGIDTCWYNPSGASAPEDLTPTMQVSSFDELLNLLRNDV